MEARRQGIRSGRRFAAKPGIEGLESRRLLSVARPQVRIQEIRAADGIRLVIQGSQRADVIRIEDNGTAEAGNVTVRLGNGKTYVAKRAISTIAVQTLGGRDQVSYALTGYLGSRRGMTVELGAGPDRFEATIDRAIDTPDALAIMVYGDGGNDHLSVDHTGVVRRGTFFPYLQGNDGNDVIRYTGSGEINSGAIVAPGLPGDAGNDTITASYTGVIGGAYLYNLTIDGGAGNDNLSNRIHVRAGSWGKIGTDEKTPALVQGGDGDDHIDYVITYEPSASVFEVHAALIGGSGRDTVQHSSNVQTDASSENASVLS
ncbi:MAG: hypothetical protein KatS3mg108_1395 [Isosphaeraceae bacterium]|jgi:hypothetical protein|nr:MAG: hypothetical protein KatS3mg108_1395 [Isosphaeraceae bacterium]